MIPVTRADYSFSWRDEMKQDLSSALVKHTWRIIKHIAGNLMRGNLGLGSSEQKQPILTA